MDSLPATLKGDLPHTPTIILGAGGACRAVLAGLVRRKAPVITLAVRNPDKALEFLKMALDKTAATGAKARTATLVPVRSQFRRRMGNFLTFGVSWLRVTLATMNEI